MDSDLTKLKNELKERITTKREEIKKDLQYAEQLGDLFHENFPYDEAVSAQRLNEARIVEIEHAIQSLSKKRSRSSKIQIGSQVELKKEDGTLLQIRLVDDAIFKSRIYPNAITRESLIGKNIFGKKVGDQILIKETSRVYIIVAVE